MLRKKIQELPSSSLRELGSKSQLSNGSSKITRVNQSGLSAVFHVLSVEQARNASTFNCSDVVNKLWACLKVSARKRPENSRKLNSSPHEERQR